MFYTVGKRRAIQKNDRQPFDLKNYHQSAGSGGYLHRKLPLRRPEPLNQRHQRCLCRGEEVRLPEPPDRGGSGWKVRPL